ncbi:MAG: protein kinase [Victivallales bacterium]
MEKENTVVIPAGTGAGKTPGPSGASGSESRSFTRPTTKFLTIQAATTHVTTDKIKLDLHELENLTGVYDRYEIIEKFAEGGQGDIKTAMDRLLRRYVAIKSLKREHVHNHEIIANFMAEAKVTAQLDHPSIVPLYEVNGDDESRIHIAMKLIHGRTLDDIIEDTILDCRRRKAARTDDIESESLKIRLENFIKICDAVSYAHNKNVIHRDLKPENVMVGQFHEVYVMDWGIAKVLSEDGNDGPDANGLCGTPGYIAPEVAEKQAYGPAGDQYALGIILFELATLKRANIGQNITEVMAKTMSGKLEALEHYFPQYRLPEELQAIIMKATALKPSDRYKSVSMLADDIRRFLRGEETIAMPDDLTRRIFRKLVKHRTLTASVVLLLLLACAGVTIFSLIRQNQSIIESKKRALTLVQLQSSITDQAHQIDRHFLRVANTLDRYSDKIVFLLKAGARSGRDNICEYRSFSSETNPPPGTVMSKFYQQKVSFSEAAYKLAPGLKLEEVDAQIQAVSPILKDLLGYMVLGGKDSADGTASKLSGQALTAGLPITFIYMGLEKGVLINYPGFCTLSDDYDPRKRMWYRAALEKNGVVWSAPYMDAFGLGVVMSASKALRDSEGRFYGVSSMDMTFEYTTELMKTVTSKNNSVVCRYLIDAEGNVILSTKLKDEQLKKAEKDFSTLKFDKFPYPQIAGDIRDASAGQFEAKNGNLIRLIGYAPVKTLGWFYVEEIDLEKLLE